MAIAAASVAVGVYARFKGLGLASLEADEYYSIRSVQNVLRVGFPEYQCGGYYPRALAFQYLAALFSLAGLSPDVATRAVAAISSVIALPAVYLLASRAGGRVAGLAALAITAISAWEVELARFARMYAPFQAVFLWYLVCFVRLAVDRDQRATVPLLVWTVLGVLTWEGGVFLPLANLLIPFFDSASGRLSLRQWGYLAVNGMLLIAAYWLATTNFRTGNQPPAFPADYDPDSVHMAGDVHEGTRPLWRVITGHPLWILLTIVPLALCLRSFRWLWSFRDRWPAALALTLALVLALFHQMAGFLGVIALTLLLGLVRREELVVRDARPYLALVLAVCVFWFAFALGNRDWLAHAHDSWLGDNRWLLLAHQFARVPDIALQIVLPWKRAVPVLGGILAALAIAALWWSTFSRKRAPQMQRVLVLVLLFMAMAVGMTRPPRQESRYIFFLYPLLWIVAIVALTNLLGRVRKWRGENSQAMAAAAVLVLFAVTEDFRPLHLLTIDTPQTLMRIGMPKSLEGHLVAHTDTRGAVAWLRPRAGHGAVLINAYPSADFYFPGFDFTFIDRKNQRFRAFACRQGTYDRWGNLPLLSTSAELNAQVGRSANAYIVADTRDVAELTEMLQQWKPRVAWKALDGQLEILALGAR